MKKHEVVVEVTVAGDRLLLFRKTEAVRCCEVDRQITIPFATRFDLRRVLGLTERAVLADFYGIDPSSITFVDAAGEHLELS